MGKSSGAGSEKQKAKRLCYGLVRVGPQHLFVIRLRFFKPLDSADTARVLVASLEHHTIRAFANATQAFVILRAKMD